MPGRTRGAFASATTIRRVTRYVAGRGVDPAALAQRVGITPATLDDPSALVPLPSALGLYHHAAEVLDDPVVGLAIAEGSLPRDYGIVGFVLANHPRLGDGFRDCARIFDALGAGFRLAVTSDATRLRVELFTDVELPHFDLLAQDGLAALLLHARTVTGAALEPQKVSFRAPHLVGNAGAALRFREVVGAEPDFRATGWAVELDPAAADVQVPDADPTLLVHLHDAVETQVARRRAAEGSLDKLIRLPNCVIDLQRGEVHRLDGRQHLTTKERAILEYLHDRRNQVVVREALEDSVWGLNRHVVSHAPAVAIRRLRQKIEDDPSDPKNLVTVFGEGWQLVVPDVDEWL